MWRVTGFSEGLKSSKHRVSICLSPALTERVRDFDAPIGAIRYLEIAGYPDRELLERITSNDPLLDCRSSLWRAGGAAAGRSARASR